jgi:hypothetical protein
MKGGLTKLRYLSTLCLFAGKPKEYIVRDGILRFKIYVCFSNNEKFRSRKKEFVVGKVHYFFFCADVYDLCCRTCGRSFPVQNQLERY